MSLIEDIAIQRNLSALHLACRLGSTRDALEALERLWAAGTAAASPSQHPRSHGNGVSAAPDSEAAAHESDQKVRQMLSVVLQMVDATGVSPLIHAVQRRDAELVAELLAAGAHPCHPPLTPSGNSPLHVAALKGDLAIVRHLLAAMNDATPLPSEVAAVQTRSPHSTASEHHRSSEDTSSALVRNMGPRPTDCKPPVAAVEAPAVAVGVKAAKMVTAAAQRCQSAVITAARSSSCGWGVDLTCANGSTPLLYSCGLGHLGIAAVLLKAGADPTRGNKDGVTPLMAAASGGHPLVVQLLLRSVRESTVTGEGAAQPPQQPPQLPSQISQHQRLLCAISAVEGNGSTALHYAARKGCSRCLSALIDAVVAAAAAVTASPVTIERNEQTVALLNKGNSETIAAKDAAPSSSEALHVVVAQHDDAVSAEVIACGAGADAHVPNAEVKADAKAGAQAAVIALRSLMFRRNGGGRDVLAEARLSGDRGAIKLVETQLAAMVPALDALESVRCAATASVTAAAKQPGQHHPTAPGCREPGPSPVCERVGSKEAEAVATAAGGAPREFGNLERTAAGGCDRAEAVGADSQVSKSSMSGEGVTDVVATHVRRRVEESEKAGAMGPSHDRNAGKSSQLQQQSQPRQQQRQRRTGARCEGETATAANHSAPQTTVVAPAAAATILTWEHPASVLESPGADAQQAGGRPLPLPSRNARDQQVALTPTAAPASAPAPAAKASSSKTRGPIESGAGGHTHPPQHAGDWKTVTMRPAASSQSKRKPSASPATATAGTHLVKHVAPGKTPPGRCNTPTSSSCSENRGAPYTPGGPGSPCPDGRREGQGRAASGRAGSDIRGPGVVGLSPATGVSGAGSRDGPHVVCGTAAAGDFVDTHLRDLHRHEEDKEEEGEEEGDHLVGVVGGGRAAAVAGARPEEDEDATACDGDDEALAGDSEPREEFVTSPGVRMVSMGPAGAAVRSALPCTWEAEALKQMQAALPAAGQLELRPQHLCGIGLQELSAAQLEGLEGLHRAALARIADARLELAVGVEVARAEEERLRNAELGMRLQELQQNGAAGP